MCTKVINYEYNFKIGINDKIFSIGSCFSSELALSLKEKGIFILSNPFGTIYNVYSIYRIFDKIFSQNDYTEKEIFFENGKYFTLDNSFSLDSDNKEFLLKKINEILKKTREYLKDVKIVVIITLGTSIIWEYKGNIIANCHKLPQTLFKKRVLDYNETVKYLKKIVDLILTSLKAKIIFTVSPVRHNISDLILNSYSKSILRVAVGDIVDNKNVYYFPSYEIVIDELRDYKYYKEDMIHLKEEAIKYVTNEFIKKLFDDNLIEYTEKFIEIKKMNNHVIKNYSDKQCLIFIKSLIKKIKELEKVKLNILLKQIQIEVAKKVLLLEENFDVKKELLLSLFENNEELKNFFITILQEDFKKLLLFNFKSKKLNKIKWDFLFKIFMKNYKI